MADRTIDTMTLQEYIDGRLDGERLLLVEDTLAADPDSAARVAAYCTNDALLRSAFAAADAPMPQSIAAILASPRRPSARSLARRHAGLARLASLAAVALIAAVAGWSANAWLSDQPAIPSTANWVPGVRDAMAAHRLYSLDVAHPIEFAASGPDDLSRLIARRLGQPTLTLPDLTPQGFRTLGARILPAGTDVAAMAMYETDAGDRVTLYVRNRQSGETALRWLVGNEIGAFYWVDDGCLYVISGRLDRDRLHALAVSSHAQLERNG